MAHDSEPIAVDGLLYRAAADFFPAQAGAALTFDDVSLVSARSDVLPGATELETDIGRGLRLQIPFVSADMDTVTESRMAIAMALNGGLGVIHYNMPEKRQLSEVDRVKYHIHGLIQDPIKVGPDQVIGDVLRMIEEKRFAFSTFPVVDGRGTLIGLLPGHVVKERYAARQVAAAMTPRAAVQTVNQRELGGDPIARADKFFTEHIGFHKLLVVDDEDRLCGLFTMSDIERITDERRRQLKPARDGSFRLVCGAAVSAPRTAAGDLDRDRIVNHVGALLERGADVVVVSTAHGHSGGVGEVVRLIRDAQPAARIIAGNVTTAAGVEFLADCGADAVKVGQGPGSICTTRIVAGVGVPQMTALYAAAAAAARCGVKLLADGGVVKAGDAVKALALADAVMCGGLFAGCPEAPGEVVEIDGKLYKQYRGMGSFAAMKVGSAARYGHQKHDPGRKAAAEGVEALKELTPSLAAVLAELVGGLRAGLGYLGARDLAALKRQARFVRVTPAGQREAAPHDVIEIRAGARGAAG